MKKSIIAGAGVAAFGLAVLPVAGVFADGTGTVTTTTEDTLTLSVPKGCNITTSTRADSTAAFGTVTHQQTATDGTTPFNVTCNDAWTLTPTVKTALSIGGDGSTSSIASGATFSGNTSAWGLKLTTSETTNIDNDFSSDYAIVNGSNKVAGSASASELTVTPSYKVYVAPGQATGNYSGTVLYTVATN